MHHKKSQSIRVFSLLLLSFILLGCSSEENEPSPYEEVNALRGVSLRLDKEIYETEGDQFILSVVNNSDEEVTYGVSYTVERLQNNEWFIVEPEEEIAFIMIAHIVNPGEEAEEEVNMSYYEPFEPGHYRLVREMAGEVMTAEFQIR